MWIVRWTIGRTVWETSVLCGLYGGRSVGPCGRLQSCVDCTVDDRSDHVGGFSPVWIVRWTIGRTVWEASVLCNVFIQPSPPFSFSPPTPIFIHLPFSYAPPPNVMVNWTAVPAIATNCKFLQSVMKLKVGDNTFYSQ